VENRFYREGIAGRWVGVRIIRHIPAVILRECGWYLADLIGSLGQQGWRRVAGEITRYRYHKTRGTVRGVIASRTLARRRPALAQSHAATT
jgi:hypothetical protein